MPCSAPPCRTGGASHAPGGSSTGPPGSACIVSRFLSPVRASALSARGRSAVIVFGGEGLTGAGDGLRGLGFSGGRDRESGAAEGSGDPCRGGGGAVRQSKLEPGS